MKKESLIVTQILFHSVKYKKTNSLTVLKIKVLAIGDTANCFGILKKYLKKSEIKIIRVPGQREDIFVQSKDEKFFKSRNFFERIKKINSIKNNFDICVVNSWGGAMFAYLCDLNYIVFFVGNDIRVPPFIKNPKPSVDDSSAPTKSPDKFNFLERRFYRKVLDNAIACVTSSELLFNYTKKYRKDTIRIDRFGIDDSLFNIDIKPLNKKKTRFTFFSPQRIDLGKGIDLLWYTLPLCKSDFEIIQVEWYSKFLMENSDIREKLLKNKPPQVKLIPLIKNTEMGKYYGYADAIMGQLGRGVFGGIEREAAFCKKPVICYSNPNHTYILDHKNVESPFQPKSNDPKTIAKLIDNVVESKDFREKLAQEEYLFVKELADPMKWAAEWDNLFDCCYTVHKSISKNSSKNNIFARKFLYVIGKLLHFKNINRYSKEFFTKGNDRDIG